MTLVCATLHRKFPNAAVRTASEPQAALNVARAQKMDAIVVQRETESDELALVEVLRAVTKAPIVLMSAGHNERAASFAGASYFLHHGQWLLVGTVVAKLISAKPVDTQP